MSRSGGRLHGDPAADGAGRAGRLDLLEVPRAGLEAVRGGGEGPDRADLDGVAAEVRGEGAVGERWPPRSRRRARRSRSAARRRPRRRSGCSGAHWMHRSRSSKTSGGDGDRLGPVALLLDEAALARPVGERLVLQRALAALVADGAVQRVVDEQELEHPLLRLACRRRVGARSPCPSVTGT